MLVAVSAIGTPEVRDIVSQARITRILLADLDQRRHAQRDLARAQHERAFRSGRGEPIQWQRGDMVLARSPQANRDGDGKLSDRLQFTGPWSVQSYDATNERVVLRYMLAIPSADGGNMTPLDSADTITVHARDLRRYQDGAALDPSHAVGPLDISIQPQAIDAAWHERSAGFGGRFGQGTLGPGGTHARGSSAPAHARLGAPHGGQHRRGSARHRSAGASHSATSAGVGCRAARRGRVSPHSGCPACILICFHLDYIIAHISTHSTLRICTFHLHVSSARFALPDDLHQQAARRSNNPQPLTTSLTTTSTTIFNNNDVIIQRRHHPTTINNHQQQRRHHR